jgi:hypothetical protein
MGRSRISMSDPGKEADEKAAEAFCLIYVSGETRSLFTV